MKLFIINGENNNEKIEIHINESLMVEDIKYKLDEILHRSGKFTKYYFRLIHKNIILFNYFLIKNYKICENDEIWFGKIENYLRKDDVIVDVFYYEQNFGSEYLIVKTNDTISTIRSIIERIHSEIINIWNLDGKQMKNDQIVTEIDTNENYKLIIRCDDGKGNERNNTFDECCYLHDRWIVDRYLFWDQIRDDNKNESTRKILINLIDEIKQIISSNNTIDDRLNLNLSDLSSSFLNLTNLFCIDMTDRIFDICNDYLRFVRNLYGNDVVRIFDRYLFFAIQISLWEYCNLRQKVINKSMDDIVRAVEVLWKLYNLRQNKKIKPIKSVCDIVIDALDYFMKYLNDSSNDWQYWLRLFMNQYLLRSFSDSDLNKWIDEHEINKYPIKIRTNRKNFNFFISFKPETIIAAKQSIAKVFNIDIKYLYCINPGGDDKLVDEDKFDDEFIIEIVRNMVAIEKSKLLGRGAFSIVYLCEDKLSNKKFALKKPIGNYGDLCRDINIYSKLNSARNIMNYSGLFRDGENICIGMEYLPGGSLGSYLYKEKQLSEQEIVRISYEILTQINELHKIGIIHRDIKPDNIVLDEDNHAKLIDFGMSKYTIGWTSKDLIDELQENTFGTICYMAPELVREEIYSEKIDIWSFGLLIVEMVTGNKPFNTSSAKVVLEIIKCTKYEFEPIIPISNELNQFINSCLNTNPDERPSAEHLLKSELFIDLII